MLKQMISQLWNSMVIKRRKQQLNASSINAYEETNGFYSYDLKSCYDNIVRSFASLVMQRAIAPLLVVKSMFSTIQKLKHVVRTLYGISKHTFGDEDWCSLNPLQ